MNKKIGLTNKGYIKSKSNSKYNKETKRLQIKTTNSYSSRNKSIIKTITAAEIKTYPN